MSSGQRDEGRPPATRPYHYSKAEELLTEIEGTPALSDETAAMLAIRAQVHATLALAAASAVRTPNEKRAWLNVATTRLSGGRTEPGPRH